MDGMLYMKKDDENVGEWENSTLKLKKLMAKAKVMERSLAIKDLTCHRKNNTF